MVPRVPRGSSIQVYTHAHLLAREYYMLIWRDGKAHHVFKDANWSFGRPFNNTVPPSERNIRLRSGDVLQHTCVYNSSTARPSENRGFAMPLKRTTETGRCIPWRRVVATPRVPPGYSAEGSRAGGGTPSTMWRRYQDGHHAVRPKHRRRDVLGVLRLLGAAKRLGSRPHARRDLDGTASPRSRRLHGGRADAACMTCVPQIRHNPLPSATGPSYLVNIGG